MAAATASPERPWKRCGAPVADRIHGLALCAGIGALELGLRLALGGAYRAVGYVERETYAAATLVARMEEEILDPAPVWDDLSTFDGLPYRGRVDLVSSGLPCQPYSLAGKRAGHADERALWPHLVRIVDQVQPGVVFIENVPPFLKHFEPVWRELRGMGFVLPSPMLRTASESGAPHIRRRVFILAAHPERFHLRDESWRGGGASRGRASGAGNVGEDAPDAAGSGLEGQPVHDTRECSAAERGRDVPTNSNRGRREGEWGGWLLDRERQTLRHDADGCGDGCRACGTPWAAESPVLRVDDGPPDRVDRLRAIGNGVVPAVAANAFRELLSSLSHG